MDKMFVTRTQGDKYVRTASKKVGFGKSGWATVARTLGGTRGIPGWVSRNKGPGAVQDMTGDRDNPRIVMSNSVRYINLILRQSEINKALMFQQERMQKAIQIKLREAKRAARFK